MSKRSRSGQPQPDATRIRFLLKTLDYEQPPQYCIACSSSSLAAPPTMLQSPTGPSGWLKVSPLEVLITRACEPSLQEPNYALHLEVAEYINQKKANKCVFVLRPCDFIVPDRCTTCVSPREAAMMIARLANHRNPHIAILSLALLDTLVQSCGYPFHLQISTKEFLNELVRRFPERPPPFPGPVMSRILELIHGWKEGICVESRWKDDLGNIRDMHRLLTFKGYRFRDSGRASSSTAASATAVSLPFRIPTNYVFTPLTESENG